MSKIILKQRDRVWKLRVVPFKWIPKGWWVKISYSAPLIEFLEARLSVLLVVVSGLD